MKFLIGYFFLIFLILSSCQKKEIRDVKEYFSWLSNPEHEMVRTKYVSGVKVTVKYLPPALQAYQELKSKKIFTAKERDSLINYYTKSKSFLLTLGPDDRKGNNSADIMWRGVSKYEQYKERNLAMNFEMSEYLSLETDKGTYVPVLTNMENTYSLSNDRNVYIVFSEESEQNTLDKAEKLDLVFNDELFDTGIHHFVFTRAQLDKVPNFIFQ